MKRFTVAPKASDTVNLGAENAGGHDNGHRPTARRRPHHASANNPRGGRNALLNILIVDDSPTIRAVVREHLQTDNIVGTAPDGVQALEQAEALRPQLIVMDLRMPRMNGLEATAIIRKRFPSMRVIIMTLDDTPEVRAACHDAGADGFVSKLWLHRDLGPEICRVSASVNARPDRHESQDKQSSGPSSR